MLSSCPPNDPGLQQFLVIPWVNTGLLQGNKIIKIFCFKFLGFLFHSLTPNLPMQNRLVAQNVLKTPLKGNTLFSINKKLLAYSTEQLLKIKSFNKEAKQYDLKLSNNDTVKSYELSLKCPWVYVVTSTDLFQVYSVNEENGDVGSKICSIKNVLSAKEIHESVVLDCSDGYYRVLSIEQIKSCAISTKKEIQQQKLYALQKKTPNSTILPQPYNQNIYIESISPNTNPPQQLITVYSIKKTGKYEKTLEIDYVQKPIAIYKDRYFLSLAKENPNLGSVEIYDINEQKLIGKLSVEGQFKYVEIRQNLLVIVLNVENTDYFWFCALNPKPDNASTLITHKIIYQRGRGDFYQFFNMKTPEALNFTDKKKQQPLTDFNPLEIDHTTSSVIYVLNKQKQKVEIIKFDHSKLLQSPFGQEKLEKKVASNTVKNKVEQQKKLETQEGERNRIKSSIQHKTQGKNFEQTQRRFVEAIVDVRIKGMMKKFEQLQARVIRLQTTMKLISEKIDQNVKNINRQEIKASVQSLFEQLTPQFEKYFSELFKQVSGVLDQGVSFYNKKLAAQADIHKQALNQIVVRTFEETEKIIEVSKKEEKLSERTEKHMKDLLDARKKWQNKTQEFEQQSRDVTFGETKVYREPTEGKVFVRADLNLSSKKET